MPIVKRQKPKAIVFDVTGVIAKKAFMSNSEESKQFMRTYVRDYVLECFFEKEFRVSLNFLKNLSELNKGQASAEGTAPPIAHTNATLEEQMETVIANVLWRLDRGVTPAMAYFHLHMSTWGYNKGILKTQVYDEVAAILKKWKEVDKIKLYVTLGNASFLKRILTQTTAGNLIGYIEAHMNLMTSGKCKDFNILARLIHEQPNDILVITRVPQDARRANLAKIPAIIILRSDYDQQAVEMLKTLDKTKANVQSKAKSRRTTEALDDEVISNLETLSGVEDDISGATSKVTEKDLHDFQVIQKLDELVWT